MRFLINTLGGRAQSMQVVCHLASLVQTGSKRSWDRTMPVRADCQRTGFLENHCRARKLFKAVAYHRLLSFIFQPPANARRRGNFQNSLQPSSVIQPGSQLPASD
jgi:hypothetical protein